MPNLAMRSPATQFSADGLDLAWPLGGEREIIAVPEDRLTLRIKRRIAEGQIVILDAEPTKEVDYQAREYRLLTGEEARRHMAEPAGPVTRVVYHPMTPEDEQDHQLEVQSVQTESDRFIKAQAARAAADEARSALLAQMAASEEAASRAIESTRKVGRRKPSAAKSFEERAAVLSSVGITKSDQTVPSIELTRGARAEAGVTVADGAEKEREKAPRASEIRAAAAASRRSGKKVVTST